jgi:hypothetical protein
MAIASNVITNTDITAFREINDSVNPDLDQTIAGPGGLQIDVHKLLLEAIENKRSLIEINQSVLTIFDTLPPHRGFPPMAIIRDWSCEDDIHGSCEDQSVTLGTSFQVI